eukprot:6178930-Pleurochrysis_carterae.AAC.1
MELNEEAAYPPVTLDSLPDIISLLRSQDDADVDDGLSFLCELVSTCYGDDGILLGERMRSSGAIMTISMLLADSSLDVRKQALYLCSNLASDAVDQNSHQTKYALMQCGAEYRLLPLLDAEDEELRIYAFAAVQKPPMPIPCPPQNLCHDYAWAEAMLRHGVDRRLEEFLADDHPL